MMEYHRQRVGNRPPTKKKRVFLPDEQEVASPHRAGHSVGLHPEDTPFPTTADGMPFHHSPQIQADEEEEVYEDETAFPRRASIVSRYNRIPTADGYIERRGKRDLQVHYVDAPPMPARSSRGRTTEAPAHQEQRSPQRSRRFHWLFFVGIVLLVMLLAPLQCATSTTANHQAGDQALEIAVTVSAHCLPLAYALASVQQQAMTVLSRLLPHAYRVVRISLILGDVTAMDARQGTATLTVFLTAYVQSIHPSRKR